MNTPPYLAEQTKQRWIDKAQNAWKSYLEAGAVLGVLGGIGLWIAFMALWGLWGFFLGWLPAGLLGWYVLRFIWLPVIAGGIMFLFAALLGGKIAVMMALKIFVIWVLFTKFMHSTKKAKNKEL